MPLHASAAASGAVPDDELIGVVEAARLGDRAAFAALYARFTRTVHGILMARIPRTEVDDVVQDVFLVAMERLSTLHDPASFPGWLAAIARHRAVDFLRRARPTAELRDVAAPAGADRAE